MASNKSNHFHVKEMEDWTGRALTPHSGNEPINPIYLFSPEGGGRIKKPKPIYAMQYVNNRSQVWGCTAEKRGLAWWVLCRGHASWRESRAVSWRLLLLSGHLASLPVCRNDCNFLNCPEPNFHFQKDKLGRRRIACLYSWWQSAPNLEVGLTFPWFYRALIGKY